MTSGTTLSVHTDRLDLVPCTLAAARASLQEPAAVAALLERRVPGSWPPDELVDALSFYARELAADPSHMGWGIWFVISRPDGSLAGSVGFKGPPDANGCVEIGYGIEPPFRQRGYATEAVKGLLGWAWSEGVTRVVAECHDANQASIRVLEKAGMARTTPRGRMLWWELRTPS
ncbi:GNAT family N-acetyltransferase [soil metagenome]